MRILILGGGGFIGNRLAKELMATGRLGSSEISRLILVDIGFPAERIDDSRVQYVEADFSDEEQLADLFKNPPSVIFHLAAIVSGEAEKNFELGMKLNFHASLQLLELCRKKGIRPRIVFASSCAVFGGDVSKVVDDVTGPKPRSSYGTQKAMVELLLNDYTRRKFVDARTLRLPTIAIRPGKPNAATSSFISGIIREPLNGEPASYPVPLSSKFWIQSPRRVIQNIVHAATIDEEALGDDRMINLPGITVSIGEMIESLEKIAGKDVTRLIKHEPNEFIERIVLTWPPHFNTKRADSLGFVGDGSVDEIILGYVDDLRLKI